MHNFTKNKSTSKYFPLYVGHIQGGPKKVAILSNSYISRTAAQDIAMKKQPNEGSFNFIPIDVYLHGHASHRNGRKALSKKSTQKESCPALL